MSKSVDHELEEFRNQMKVPSKFEDGFNWSSLVGALFIGLLMVPGAIYMGLLAGQGIGPAAQWVTVILFLEVARRTHRYLKRAEIFVLFFMAGAAMGMPFAGLLWHQFFINSDAAAVYGIAELLPTWYAPDPASESYAMRSFFHLDWLPAMGLVIFATFFGQLKAMILGYGLFRVASDVEKLPFPMAPVGAQGIMALAEDVDESDDDKAQKRWRWRVFSIGGALGMAFGAIYLGVPTLTAAFTGKAVQIFPIPFSDFTPKTGNYLPAVATGIAWDATHLITGMVLPFGAMLGSFIGLLITMVANPLLYKFETLTSWVAGDSTVVTLFKNNVDFYFSFQIGIAVAICLAGFYQVYRSLAKRKKENKNKQKKLRGVWSASLPEGRGDINTWIIIACYFIVTLTYIFVSGYLIGWHKGVMIVLFLLGFVYTPLISYVTARLEGIAGQVVEIPMVKEASLILSGYQGVAIWFLPIPIANYGMMTVFYRQCELTGTKFTSIWKTKVLLYPIILISSIVFMDFIWGLAEVPSAVYPFAQMMWELQAANACIMFSSTLGEYSIFEEAFKWTYLGAGAVFGVLLFTVLTKAGAPIFLVYGVVRGLGQSMPHGIIPEFIGALIGRFYFRPKFGVMWRQYIPVVAAGFACGQGLVSTLCIGITFLSKSVVQLPF
jgi:hypothetical protein